MFRAFAVIALLVYSTAVGQDSKNLIIGASRSGTVEIINPSTLRTVSRIQLDLPFDSVGLNGVSANAEGSLLYVEGPIPTDPHGCCARYVIDLATLQIALAPNRIPREMASDRRYLSPDGRWLFGVRSSRAPVLHIYDVRRAQIQRQLTAEPLDGDWWARGVWSGDRFYMYAVNDKGSIRVWSISPETQQLGPGTGFARIGRLSGCAGELPTAIAASEGSLFAYEEFGFTTDRRSGCAGHVPGGAWVLDPATGQVTRQIAPDLHFSELLSNKAGSELYGVSTEDPNWAFPAQLVRIDPADDRILQSRYLDPGLWRIAMARLGRIPSGDVHMSLHFTDLIRPRSPSPFKIN